MGKTVLLRIGAITIANDERQQLENNEKNIEDIIFPILLRLSDLAEQNEEILDVIPQLIRRDYPQTPNVIIDLLKKKLTSGYCFLLLDALDEVAKEHRHRLIERLNRFARNYSCPIIITSRITGYNGTYIDDAKAFEITPFTHGQIENYIKNWFANITKRHVQLFNRKQDVLIESKVVHI